MLCDDAAEYVSAVCDGEAIPPAIALHISICPECQARLRDYLSFGAQLRIVANLDPAAPVPSRIWTQPRNPIATWWRKGLETMRIPRLALGVLVAAILVLVAANAVDKVRAHDTGTVVLLSITGPSGPPVDCPLSTVDKNQACLWNGNMGSQSLAYRIRLLASDGSRVRLAIRTRTYQGRVNLSAFTQDADPLARVKEVWLEPGRALEFKVPEVGTLVLKGEWMDHVPIMGGLDPGPTELRLGRPLLLKDNKVVGDLSSVVSGYFGLDEKNQSMALYVPREGRFLLALMPMKGAVEARVGLGRISFEDGGHAWEIASGVPICRADHLWVLHDTGFKGEGSARDDAPSLTALKLVPTERGLWTPEGMKN